MWPVAASTRNDGGLNNKPKILRRGLGTHMVYGNGAGLARRTRALRDWHWCQHGWR